MLIRWVILWSWAYWIYLWLNSSMFIVFDSVGYESLARSIVDDGWTKYFITGPNREPLYTFLISVSMIIADALHLPYQKVIGFIQISFLGLGQILLAHLLNRMRVVQWVVAVVLLYWSISPALINSSLSLFSEIATYPLVLGICCFGFDILDRKPMKAFVRIMMGATLGVLMLGFACVKAIAQYSLTITCIWMIGVCWCTCRDRHIRASSIGAILMALMIMYAGVVPIKTLNKIYNGNDVFTNRGPAVIYGNFYRRTLPHNAAQMKACLAMVAGENLCRKVADKKDCKYWHFSTVDEYSFAANLARAGHNEESAGRILFAKAVGMLIQHPVSVIGFGLLESSKMFFWESTQIGFVDYPQWLSRIYGQEWIKSIWRLLVSLATIIAFFSFGVIAFKKQPSGIDGHQTQMQFVLFLALPFMLLYGISTVLTRYAFPMVPLFFLMAGVCLNYFLLRVHAKSL